jgi:dCTP deaminase
MVLSDRDIRKYLDARKIVIQPTPEPDQFGTCSIDLRLGTTFLVFQHSRYPHIDSWDCDVPALMTEITVGADEPFIMQPREFLLATTVESIELDVDVLARLEGRSSLGRLGIIVHGTSSVFDPGWRGHPTLELGNLGIMPVILHPSMRICSFTFEQVSSPVETPYYAKHGQKYAGHVTPVASKLTSEFRAPSIKVP